MVLLVGDIAGAVGDLPLVLVLVVGGLATFCAALVNVCICRRMLSIVALVLWIAWSELIWAWRNY